MQLTGELTEPDRDDFFKHLQVTNELLFDLRQIQHHAILDTLARISGIQWR
ncbi:MAG: hypothetical protein ACC641_06555 [Acidiferrobacterales bacterium]